MPALLPQADIRRKGMRVGLDCVRRAIRRNTQDCSGLRGENLFCSYTPSANICSQMFAGVWKPQLNLELGDLESLLELIRN
jgi:hypothetical protein